MLEKRKCSSNRGREQEPRAIRMRRHGTRLAIPVGTLTVFAREHARGPQAAVPWYTTPYYVTMHSCIATMLTPENCSPMSLAACCRRPLGLSVAPRHLRRPRPRLRPLPARAWAPLPMARERVSSRALRQYVSCNPALCRRPNDAFAPIFSPLRPAPMGSCLLPFRMPKLVHIVVHCPYLTPSFFASPTFRISVMAVRSQRSTLHSTRAAWARRRCANARLCACDGLLSTRS